MNIGMIGVGAMGAPMAVNLQKSGHDVVVFDVNPDRLQNAELGSMGKAHDVAGLAAVAELLITMTPDDTALREVVERVLEMPATRRKADTFVDLSSTSLQATREAQLKLTAVGLKFLDGAVFGGGVAAARAGKSPIVVSGDRSTFDRIAGVLASLGEVRYVGDTGKAKIVKILNNLLVGAFCVAAGEIVSVGLKAGLPLELVVESLIEGSGSSYVLERYYRSYVKSGSFGLGLIPISYMVKDLTLACELAQEVRVPATLAEAVRQIYQMGRGLIGDVPFPEILELFNRCNDVRESVAAVAR